MLFGVADYGMNVWYGGNFDTEYRLEQLQAIGYDGVERLQAASAEEAMHKAARFRRLGMGFGTCLGPNAELSIQWTAALGRNYIWTNVTGQDFDTFCRQVNEQALACRRWGIRVALHNHMGTLVETQPQLEAFLARCPGCGLILDTAHLAVAGGNPVDIVNQYADRLAAIHLKDWFDYQLDTVPDNWWQRGRFCELGAGNIGLDNAAVMQALVTVGYDDWIFIEQDTHLQDPLLDLTISRNYLRNAGY